MPAPNEVKPHALEIIKVTSKLREKKVPASTGNKLDHCYTTSELQSILKKPPKLTSIEPTGMEEWPEEMAATDGMVDTGALLIKEESSTVATAASTEISTGQDAYENMAGDEQHVVIQAIDNEASGDEEYEENVQILTGTEHMELSATSEEAMARIEDCEKAALVDDAGNEIEEENPMGEGCSVVVEKFGPGTTEATRKSPRASGSAKRARVSLSSSEQQRRVKQKVIHICDVCGKAFKTYQEFADHHRVHTGEKPYVCDICGKAFGRSYTAAEHRRLHTGEKPYQCDVCGKRFVTAGDLGKHRRLHTGEKPYKCTICGKEMSTGRENADHRRMHEGGISCPICGKQFTRLHNMKEHLSGAHTGIKRYSCPICSKMFAYSGSLQYHKRVHKDDAIKCQVCDKLFTRIGELNRHEKREHKTQVVKIEVFS